MNWLTGTLWDLIAPKDTGGAGRKPKRGKRKQVIGEKPQAAVVVEVKRRAAATALAKPRTHAKKKSMQDRYDALVEEMKRTYGVRVRKWRKTSSGVAWAIRYADGREVKLIESPYPRGPMSCAIFMHEIGHHAIGLGVYRPRCLEEYHVWVWALNKMREKGFNVTPAVEQRMERAMRYAVAKAKRRGIQQVPPELLAYC